jgi:hypothetical protein
MEGGLYKYPMKNILRTAKFLTPAVDLRCKKPTEALQSAKGPGNTFD